MPHLHVDSKQENKDDSNLPVPKLDHPEGPSLLLSLAAMAAKSDTAKSKDEARPKEPATAPSPLPSSDGKRVVTPQHHQPSVEIAEGGKQCKHHWDGPRNNPSERSTPLSGGGRMTMHPPPPQWHPHPPLPPRYPVHGPPGAAPPYHYAPYPHHHYAPQGHHVHPPFAMHSVKRYPEQPPRPMAYGNCVKRSRNEEEKKDGEGCASPKRAPNGGKGAKALSPSTCGMKRKGRESSNPQSAPSDNGPGSKQSRIISPSEKGQTSRTPRDMVRSPPYLSNHRTYHPPPPPPYQHRPYPSISGPGPTHGPAWKHPPGVASLPPPPPHGALLQYPHHPSMGGAPPYPHTPWARHPLPPHPARYQQGGMNPPSPKKAVGDHSQHDDQAPNSLNCCVPLKPPLPARFYGDNDKAKDARVPDFHSLVNFPDNLAKNRRPESRPAGSCTPGTSRCVMCGIVRLCSASPSMSKGETKTPSPSVVPTEDIGSSDQIITGDASKESKGARTNEEEGTLHIIPRQNKGLCTACDVTVWVVTASNLEIKWCKGCKNFRPWAAFGDKGLATKCVRCRERQREKYAMQKDSLRLKRKQQQDLKLRTEQEHERKEPKQMDEVPNNTREQVGTRETTVFKSKKESGNGLSHLLAVTTQMAQ